MLGFFKHVAVPAAAFGLAAVLSCSQSRANTIKAFIAAGTTPTSLGGGQFEYDYQITLDTSGQLQSGDYITLYDVPGLINGASSFSNVGGYAGGTFTPSYAFTGQTPPSQIVTDSGSALNITLTFNGTTLDGGSATFNALSTAGNGDKLLGKLELISTDSLPANLVGQYAQSDHAELVPGNPVEPSNGPVVLPGVPLPATASTGLTLFAGLGALVGLRKLTSRRSVA